MTGAPDHTDEVTITVIGQGNAIVSNILDTAKLVDGNLTGLTQDGTNTIMTTLNYESVLVNQTFVSSSTVETLRLIKIRNILKFH